MLQNPNRYPFATVVINKEEENLFHKEFPSMPYGMNYEGASPNIINFTLSPRRMKKVLKHFKWKKKVKYWR